MFGGGRLLHLLLPFATGFPFALAPLRVASGLLRRAPFSGEGEYYIAFLELVKPFALRGRLGGWGLLIR